jgi:hypothetical protein
MRTWWAEKGKGLAFSWKGKTMSKSVCLRQRVIFKGTIGENKSRLKSDSGGL